MGTRIEDGINKWSPSNLPCILNLKFKVRPPCMYTFFWILFAACFQTPNFYSRMAQMIFCQHFQPFLLHFSRNKYWDIFFYWPIAITIEYQNSIINNKDIDLFSVDNNNTRKKKDKIRQILVWIQSDLLGNRSYSVTQLVSIV